jgi:hypothetical protein
MRFSAAIQVGLVALSALATLGVGGANGSPNTDLADANLVMPFSAEGRTTFLAVSNVGDGTIAARWSFYDQTGELVTEVDRTIAGEGTDVVDVTRVESRPPGDAAPLDLTGRNGFVVVSGDGEPRLLGSFTIANVATSSAFGGSAVGLGLVGDVLPGFPANPLAGTTFSPASLGDNLLILLAVDDSGSVPTSLTSGDRPGVGDVFDVTVTLLRNDAIVAGTTLNVRGSAVFTSLEDLFEGVALEGSATIRVLPETPGVALLGFYGQALGAFGAGQNLRQAVVGGDDICQHLPASGQRTSFPANKNGAPGSPVPDDGALKSGAALAYVDNGDGTVTDLNTRLTWEKKSDDEGLHDRNRTYSWSTSSGDSVWDWLDQVNEEGGAGFAGHNDWRLPNVKELLTIVDFEESEPAVSSVFDHDCAPRCNVLNCSCTLGGYWSSTTVSGRPTEAYWVSFRDGRVVVDSKDTTAFVRAVRGGS